MITVLQAAAIVTLWRSGRFDTLDIATALGGEPPVRPAQWGGGGDAEPVARRQARERRGAAQQRTPGLTEADICRVLDAVRHRERPDVHVVGEVTR